MSNWCSWARFGLTVAVVEFVAHEIEDFLNKVAV
jgi:hypothetical protein